MKRLFLRNRIAVILIIVLMTGRFCFGQSPAKIVEDFKASSVNQPGKEYPQVNSEGRVRVQISALGANVFTTISYGLTVLLFLIPVAYTFMVQVAGEAVSRFLLKTRISML